MEQQGYEIIDPILSGDGTGTDGIGGLLPSRQIRDESLDESSPKKSPKKSPKSSPFKASPKHSTQNLPKNLAKAKQSPKSSETSSPMLRDKTNVDIAGKIRQNRDGNVQENGNKGTKIEVEKKKKKSFLSRFKSKKDKKDSKVDTSIINSD